MTYTKKFTIKRVSADIDEARIVSWAVAEGSLFHAGDLLLEIETDKSVIEIAAEEGGTMKAHLVKEGDSFAFDEPVAELEVEGEPTESSDGAEVDHEAVPASSKESIPDPDRGELSGIATSSLAAHATETAAPADEREGRRIASTPAARNLARGAGMDVGHIDGTGPGGRVTRADVARMLAEEGAGIVKEGGDSGAVPPTHVTSVPADATGEEAGRLVSTRHGPLHVVFRSPRKRPQFPYPAVVLLHGMFGDADTWAAMSSTLTATGVHVVVPDLPGHGKTPSNAASFDQVVDAVADAVQQAVQGPVSLVGHSFGAAVAARVSRRLGNALHSLTLIAPVGLGTEIGQSFLSGMTNAQTEEAIARELRKLTENSPSLSPPYLRTLQARLQDRHHVLNTLCTQLARNGVQQIDISADLASIRQPMAVIQGRNDGIVPWMHVLNAPPRAALHLLPKVGHMPQWEAPALTADIILDMVRRTAAG